MDNQQDSDYLEQYANTLGRLHGNLASLEIAIRFVLFATDTPEDRKFPYGFMLTSAKVGERLPENWLTSWHPLGRLVARYNDLHGAHGLISLDIKDLRDAFAHGRVFGEGVASAPFLHLMRFSQAVDGSVSVEQNWTLTPEFVREQSMKVRAALDVVGARMAAVSTPQPAAPAATRP